MKCLIIGQGSIGKEVATALSRAGHDVVGLARTPKAYPKEVALKFWQKDALTLSKDELSEFDVIAIIITPDDNPDRPKAYQDSYLAVAQHIARLNASGRVLFVSSTSVYGQNNGEWVDEHTTPNPASPTAQILLDAENVLIGAYGKRAIMVRPSGIYGKSERLIRLAKTAHQTGVPSHHYTNRIHHDDLVRIIWGIITMDNPKSLYIASDGEPATSAQVLSYICQMYEYPAPKILPSAPTGKRIKHNVNKDWIGINSYRQGYGAG